MTMLPVFDLHLTHSLDRSNLRRPVMQISMTFGLMLSYLRGIIASVSTAGLPQDAMLASTLC